MTIQAGQDGVASDFISTSSGAGDSGKVAKLNARGKIDNSFLEYAIEAFFGDGSDGSATISSNTDLTRDMYYDDLTINTGITLDTKGFRVFVKGTLTCNGTGKIVSNGNNGSNGSGSSGGAGGTAPYTTGTMPIPLAGGDGADGPAYSGSGIPGVTSDAGTDQAKAVGEQDAAQGGQGGAGQRPGYSEFNGGTGGVAGQETGTMYARPNGYMSLYNLFDLIGGTLTQFTVMPQSTGGGSGAPGATSGGSSHDGGGGGGAGSSGGVVWIAAKNIASADIEAIGGDGGQGGNGGEWSADEHSGAGGGGAGGNGGVIIVIYLDKTTLTTDVSGGTGGAIGATGNTTNASAGSNGNSGRIIELDLSAV